MILLRRAIMYINHTNSQHSINPQPRSLKATFLLLLTNKNHYEVILINLEQVPL